MSRFILLLLLLTTSILSGQNVSVTASIGLVDDFCTTPVSNPDADCINVPLGNTSLTYLPGDGDILITYRINNNTTGTIVMARVEDSDRGVVFPVATVSIPAGGNLIFNRVFPAETAPRNVTATVTADLEAAGGSSATVTDTYDFEVLGADADIFVYPILAEDICTDPEDLATCGVAPVTTPTTLTLAPGDPIYLEFRIVNTGLIPLTNNDWEDSFYGLLFDDNGTNINPGSDIRFRTIQDAPSIPGTYNNTVTYTGMDDFGNTIVRTTSYTLIVEEPDVDIFVYPILAEDICTDPGDLATCGVAPTTTPTTLTLAPGDPIYLEFRILNIGIVTLTNNDWEDSFYGLLFEDNGTNINPGSDIRFRTIQDAPSIPGTYNNTVTYTGMDDFGNTVIRTTTYTLIVVEPDVDIFVYPILAEDICTDPGDLATCGVAPTTTPTTLTLAPGDPIYLEFRILNIGIVTLTNNDWEDSFYGLLFEDNGTNINPGSDIRFRTIQDAPSVPGTYNNTVTYTGMDDFGNTVIRTTTYTLIVVEPDVDIFVYPILAEDICTDPGDLATCGVAPTTTPTTLTLAPGDPIYLEFRIQNIGIVTLTNNDWEDSFYGLIFEDNGTNINPGVDIRFRSIQDAPSVPGTYNNTVTYTGMDDFGNTVIRTTTYTLIVDCAIGDNSPPEAICQDISVMVEEGQATTILPGEINNGSNDNCGGVSGSLDITEFDCSDVGPNIVTLTVTDDAGNQSQCQATVTVEAEENVSEGPTGTCVSITQALGGANEFIDIVGPQGKLVASVRKNINPLVTSMQVDLYRENSFTQGNGDGLRLSKRLTLTPLNAAGNPVNPINPISIRIFYREVELADLESNSGISRGNFALVKDDSECGPGGFTGANQVILNANFAANGCNDLNQYYQANVLTFSTFFLFASDVGLPVEWVDFNAQRTGNDVQLSWSTATEYNSSHFVVERSQDGRSYDAIGEVLAAGESNTLQTYTFLDQSPQHGNNYYRLRQVDFDEREDFSEVRLVTFSDITGKVILYPNPTSDRLYLDGFAPGPISIYNLQGQIVHEQYYAPGQAIQIGHLPSGKYLLSAGEESLRWMKQ